MNQVKEEISRLTDKILKAQSEDGSWRYCFENGIMTDAYMIILLRTLHVHDEGLIRKLAERILRWQGENGTWKLYADEKEGNLSATIEGYYALLFSGQQVKNSPAMQAAKQFILSRGGLDQAGPMTKVMLSLTGNYPWPKTPLVPLEMILLPPSFPLSFYDFVGYARVHIAPVLVAWDRHFSLKTRRTPDLSDLIVEQTAGLIGFLDRGNAQQRMPHHLLPLIQKGIKELPYLPQHLHRYSLQRLERFMLRRIEPNGTLYSYFSSTFLMIYSLLSLGYSRKSHIILRALKGLRSFACETKTGVHMQNSPSEVWDTALLSHALQEAGVAATNPGIQKAGQYLLKHQQNKYGDWKIHNPSVLPGGWGFSDINTRIPDVDDSTAALRAIKNLAEEAPYQEAWERGLQWVLSMQNADGGWPAFEKNTDKEILRRIPVEGFDAVSTDPSSPDLTGRALEFLGHKGGFSLDHPDVQKGVEWLIRHQQKDGSWYGRWGVCFTYGTWAAVTGMSAVGVPARHPVIRKAVGWMTSIQNEDGGWGESCDSDVIKKYVPLGASTLSQTAWMVDALVSVSMKPTRAIKSGVDYLLQSIRKEDWTTEYPTGAGLPGGFYVHYHSYRYIWPLIALSRYHRKFADFID